MKGMRRALGLGLLVATVCGGMRPLPLEAPALAERAGCAEAAIAVIELNRDRLWAHQPRKRVRADALAAPPILAAAYEAVAQEGWSLDRMVEAEDLYGPSPVRPLPPMPLGMLMAAMAAEDDARARQALLALLGPARLERALAGLGAVDSRFLPDGAFETTAVDLARMLAKLARAEVVSPAASEAIARLVRARSGAPRHLVALRERSGMHAAIAVLTEDDAADPARLERLAAGLCEAAEADCGRDWRRLPMVRIPSGNHGDREGAPIDTIVLHHTVIGPGARDVAAYFRRPDIEASSHYIVGKDGLIVQAVDDCRKAWHAGVSQFRGRTGVNAFSIGIEIVNLGDGRDPYPDAQYRALAKLVLALQREYGIPRSRITGHRDVALPRGRKTDPSDNFSYGRLWAEIDRLPTP